MESMTNPEYEREKKEKELRGNRQQPQHNNNAILQLFLSFTTINMGLLMFFIFYLSGLVYSKRRRSSPRISVKAPQKRS